MAFVSRSRSLLKKILAPMGAGLVFGRGSVLRGSPRPSMATILASTLGAMGVGFTAGLGAAYMASPENRIRWRQGAAKRLRWIADNLELGTRKESVEIRRERRREVFDELNAR